MVGDHDDPQDQKSSPELENDQDIVNDLEAAMKYKDEAGVDFSDEEVKEILRPIKLHTARSDITAFFVNVISNVRGYWHTDVASKLLIISLITVIVSTVVFATLLVRLTLHPVSTNANTGSPMQAVETTVNGTPTTPEPSVFQTPDTPSSEGVTPTASATNNVHLETPTATSVGFTPTPQATATVPPDQQFDVVITHIVPVVKNGEVITISLYSAPNVEVWIEANYDTSPHNFTSKHTKTDNVGNANTIWNVQIEPDDLTRASFTAQVKAFARASDSQYVMTSATHTITIQIP